VLLIGKKLINNLVPVLSENPLTSTFWSGCCNNDSGLNPRGYAILLCGFYLLWLLILGFESIMDVSCGILMQWHSLRYQQSHSSLKNMSVADLFPGFPPTGAVSH